MRLLTYDAGDGAPRAGLLAGEGDQARVLDLGAVAGRPIPDVAALAEMHPGMTLATLYKRVRGLEPLALKDGARLADVAVLAPVPRPPKVTCVGVNYRGHAAEMGRSELPAAPMLFAKARTAVSAPSGVVRLAAGQDLVDWEVELCVVVGRGGYRIARGAAREHILGYTVACDVSDRAAQRADGQFYRAKSFPGFCPCGPLVVTTDAIDPGALRLTTRVNGALMQDGRTDDLIFGVDHLVEYISSVTELEPGDLILTGTPAGVGAGRKPPVFLKPGDRVECAVEGIGAIDFTVERA